MLNQPSYAQEGFFRFKPLHIRVCVVFWSMKFNLRYFRVDLRDFCVLVDNLYVSGKESVLKELKISLKYFVWKVGGLGEGLWTVYGEVM